MRDNSYSGLSYKTLFNENPRGMQRVFWACHPADHELCFPVISRDILECNSKTAIWYYDPRNPELSGESLDLFKKDLDQMLLVVIPVTTHFLYEPSMARDVIFPYALENNIAVLPILMETGLERPFNETCKNLQYLNRLDEDPTAIPYKEKLGKYLKTILVSDKLETQIREAFYAYIFLSYRKKDRFYAQQIMEMIHRNDLCRDIAIWYDEYLTPGEDFNDSIRDAFVKSDIFVMVVTDYLMNLPNYVYSDEFPMAKRSEVTILPILAEDGTQKTLDKLKELFPGTPDCVQDEETLAARIKSILDNLKKPRREDTAEHLYFIGLAYLNGIDVEKNSEQGASLIKASAEKGLPEAQRHLAYMYNTGTGVKRDYDRAADEQRKYVELLERVAEPGDNDSSYEEALLELGDMLYELRKLPEAMEVYDKLAEHAKKKEGIFEADWILSVALERQGKVAQSMGNNEKAFDYYDRCLGLRERLSVEHPYGDVIAGWEIVSERLGDLLFNQGKYDTAYRQFAKCLELNQMLVQERKTAEYMRHCSLSYVRLGDCEINRGNLESAQTFYERGLAYNKRIMEEAANPLTERDVSVSYERIGHVSLARGLYDQAMDWYLNCLTLRRELTDKSGTLEALQDLGIILDTLGTVFRDRRDYNKAREYFSESLKIRESLVRQSPTPDFRTDLSISYNRFGQLFRYNGDYNRAQDYYERALEIRKGLAEEVGTPEAYHYMVSNYLYMGDMERERKDEVKARECYLLGLDIAKSADELHNNPEITEDYGTICERLGDVELSGGDMEMAAKYYRECVAARERLIQLKPTIEARRCLGISLERLGDIAREAEKYQEAAAYFKQSLDISYEIEKMVPTAQALRDVSIGLEKYGVARAFMEEIDEADELLKECLSIRKRLADENSSVQAYEDLKMCYAWLIEIADANDDMVRMMEYASAIRRIEEHLKGEGHGII